jgi:hypothetical protein
MSEMIVLIALDPRTSAFAGNYNQSNRQPYIHLNPKSLIVRTAEMNNAAARIAFKRRITTEVPIKAPRPRISKCEDQMGRK